MGIKAPAKAKAPVKAPAKAKAPVFDPSTDDHSTATENIHPLFGRAKVAYASATKIEYRSGNTLREHLGNITPKQATFLFCLMTEETLRYTRNGGHIHVTPRDENGDLAGGVQCFLIPKREDDGPYNGAFGPLSEGCLAKTMKLLSGGGCAYLPDRSDHAKG